MAKSSKPFGNIKKGAFHEYLGIPEDQPIQPSQIQQGLNSQNAHVRKMAAFAKAAKKFKH
jgi:hypothetical protein